MKLDEKVLLLTDYRGGFWSSTKNRNTSTTMDVVRLVGALRDRGLNAASLPAAQALEHSAGEPAFVLYSSSEEEESYKRFLEAVVLGLERRGHTPIPKLDYLLAHHNKAVMESLRGAVLPSGPGHPQVRVFGSLEEFDADLMEYPLVLKPARGAGSVGVTLVHGPDEARIAAARMSRSQQLPARLRAATKKWLRPGYVPPSSHQNPFVGQAFIPGLSGDFKVLRYGSRLYVVGRGSPEGDFRASGAGLLDYRAGDRSDLTPVLNAAWQWAEQLASPFASLDVAYDPEANEGQPALIEFQCVMFGPAAVENSVGYFTGKPGAWHFVEESPDLEAVFANACAEHIRAVTEV